MSLNGNMPRITTSVIAQLAPCITLGVIATKEVRYTEANCRATPLSCQWPKAGYVYVESSAPFFLTYFIISSFLILFRLPSHWIVK